NIAVDTQNCSQIKSITPTALTLRLITRCTLLSLRQVWRLPEPLCRRFDSRASRSDSLASLRPCLLAGALSSSVTLPEFHQRLHRNRFSNQPRRFIYPPA